MRKLLSLGAVLLLASIAHAQITSPPPNLQGQASVHAWSVAGVTNTGNLITVLSCTNTLASTVIVGVEVFGPARGAALNNASTTSLSVASGATVVFTMAAGSPALVTNGSARVLATTSSNLSHRIICSAILADKANDPPTVMTDLPVYVPEPSASLMLGSGAVLIAALGHAR